MQSGALDNQLVLCHSSSHYWTDPRDLACYSIPPTSRSWTAGPVCRLLYRAASTSICDAMGYGQVLARLVWNSALALPPGMPPRSSSVMPGSVLRFGRRRRRRLLQDPHVDLGREPLPILGYCRAAAACIICHHKVHPLRPRDGGRTRQLVLSTALPLRVPRPRWTPCASLRLGRAVGSCWGGSDCPAWRRLSTLSLVTSRSSPAVDAGSTK